MARCREYIQNVTTITKVVRISDNGKASQIPFTPIMAGNTMKHGTRKTNPRKTGKSSVSCPLKPSDSAPLC